MQRRRFLGLSTLASASLFGWSTFSLSSCKKIQRQKLAQTIMPLL